MTILLLRNIFIGGGFNLICNIVLFLISVDII